MNRPPMPSNTPLPSKTLLALADAMAEAVRIERDLSEAQNSRRLAGEGGGQ